MKHIVHIIANSPTSPYLKGFAEHAHSINESRVKFTFIMVCHDYPKLKLELKDLNSEVYWVKFNPNKRKIGFVITYIKLKKILKKLKPDIVNTHLFDDSVPGLLAAKKLKIPKRIITKNDTSFHFNYAKKGVKWDNFNNKNATNIIAISNESKEFIQKNEENWKNKITMIHHGVQSSIFDNSNVDKEFLTQFKIENHLNDKFVIGTVARFIEWKGYRKIIEVAKKTIRTIPNAVFVLIGSGSQKEEIIELIKKNELENNFRLPGFIDPSKMPSIYSGMNAYLHTATLEPFGFVIAEALIAGVPVVSNPTGAALDSIDNKKNGWITEYDNIDQMVEAIVEIKNKNIVIPWNKANHVGCEKFELSIMYEKYLELSLNMKESIIN